MRLPVTSFSELLTEYTDTPGYTMSDIDRIVRDHRAEVIARLPRLPGFPSPEEIQELSATIPTEPFVLEEPVAVGVLREHLRTHARATTPEMALEVLHDGTHVIRAGVSPNRVESHPGWSDFTRDAPVRFHTHPGSTDPYMRSPSMEDLVGATNFAGVSLIGSYDGVTGNPGVVPDRSVEAQWASYVVNDRGIDPEIAATQGVPHYMYGDFICQVVNPSFIRWDQIPDDTTLAAVVTIAPILSRKNA